jgi:hypothetical protein
LCKAKTESKDLIRISLIRYYKGITIEHYVIDELVLTQGLTQGEQLTVLMKELIDKNLLLPIPLDLQIKLDYSFNHTTTKYDFARDIIVPDVKHTHQRIYGKWFFGFDPTELVVARGSEMDLELNTSDVLLSTLQNVIKELGLNINIRLYKSYTELMQKVLYDYGCLRGVKESMGTWNKKVRKSIEFPKRKTFNSRSLYLKEKLYYIDIVGAYPSCTDGIPLDLSENSEKNYKINELFQKLYRIRMRLKKAKNPIATTIKFMMNSCIGYSMKKNKPYKYKYRDLDEVGRIVEKNVISPLLVKIDGKCITTMKTFSPNFSYPQFAKDVLNRFHKKVEEIEQHVHIIYRNIDAFIINERDFKILDELGFINDDELGKFKVEKIFTELAIVSSNQWMGILEDGSVHKRGFGHLDTTTWEEFQQRVR